MSMTSAVPQRPRFQFSWKKAVLLALVLALVVGVVVRIAGGRKRVPAQRPQPVRAALAVTMDVPMYFLGLGTVTPENTVVVRSRVDGEIMALHFTEGREVSAGDLLAEIDPRPYEVQLKEAQGALARDQALLKDARLDLARYRKLIKEESVSAQQLQAQESLVGQYEGAVRVDQANIASAQLQLTYCRVTAPVSGRLGLKQVDVGNIIHASDTSGLVVITQMRPMNVIFTLVEKQLPEVLSAMREGPRTVEALEQDGKTLLGTGTLLTLDNQIDASTGTVKAKAVFDNTEGRLFPNQFVSTKLLVRMLENVLVIPTAAVQRNIDGEFVYLVRADAAQSPNPGRAAATGPAQKGKQAEVKAVTMRAIQVGYSTADHAVVLKGLSSGDMVVTDGVDRLREGSQVTPLLEDAREQPPADAGSGSQTGS